MYKRISTIPAAIAYVAGDCKSLQKKISAELRGLAFMHGVAWMAAMAVMRHTSDGR
jgi:hypothetical protein